MARVISGTLTTTAFQPTANPGQYLVENCTFNNQTDATGNGAYDIGVGFLLYTPVIDPNSLELVPGLVNRYIITALDLIDQDSINITVQFAHDEQQYDLPADYSVCIISEPSVHHKLGAPVSTSVYPALAAGLDIATLAIDAAEVTDNLDLAPNASTYLYTQVVPSTEWIVNHTKNSVNFNYTLFDGNGMLVFPDWIEMVDFNTLKVHLLEPMTGKLALSFM